MQTCFRQHPDIYGAELDGEELEAPPQETQDAIARNDPARTGGEKVEVHSRESAGASAGEAEAKRERAKAATQQVQREHNVDEKSKSETQEAVPKAWHDATSTKGTEE